MTRTAVARELRAADFIFACTDSHGSRAVIQQIAYQYLIPCVDMGSIITARAGQIAGIHGRVQALAPGLPCFTCCELLDSEEVRRDMMNAEERSRDQYIQGAHEPAPAVISINGTVTSMAMTMFLAMMVGVPSAARHLLYDARAPVTASRFVHQQSKLLYLLLAGRSRARRFAALVHAGRLTWRYANFRPRARRARKSLSSGKYRQVSIWIGFVSATSHGNHLMRTTVHAG